MGKWTVLIEKDEDTESVAVVSISPSTTAEYKIVMSAYSFEDGFDAGHYGLIVFHEWYAKFSRNTCVLPLMWLYLLMASVCIDFSQ